MELGYGTFRESDRGRLHVLRIERREHRFQRRLGFFAGVACSIGVRVAAVWGLNGSVISTPHFSRRPLWPMELLPEEERT